MYPKADYHQHHPLLYKVAQKALLEKVKRYVDPAVAKQPAFMVPTRDFQSLL